MESLPAYVSIVFTLTTLAAVAFLLRAIRAVGQREVPSKILIFLLPLWIVFQAVLSIGGFYQIINSFPPRLIAFGVFPAILLIVSYFIFFRSSFISRLPIKLLTVLHVIRIPVEIVLLWLFLGGTVPRAMTFEGRNFDILSGLLAPIVYFAAFRGSEAKKWLLIAFNVVGLLLLANIVSIAILSLPTSMDQITFEQPNRAVLFFPYIWLPTIIVPIVLFAHLSSLWKLILHREK